jgi:myosin-1
MDAGVMETFSTAVRTDSPGIRVNIGKALLSITEDKENRGIVLQRGGAKVLITVLKHATSATTYNRDATALDATYLDAVQALAKLAITSSPVQVFGPSEGVMYDVIRPLSSMLQHPSSTLLQRFESMMALTNLSSQSVEVASRIAGAEGLLSKVEFLLLEEHTLIRRAAMELLCNLIVGSDTVFERYGGEGNLSSVKSRLQVVLALSDVDDLPTRLAAAGALATLTAAPGACQALVTLQLERHRVIPILAQLIDPSAARSHDTRYAEMVENETHPGLVHRGIICARNIVLSIGDEESRKRLSKEANETGLSEGLTSIMRAQSVDAAILRATAETLKVLSLDNQN